ncbi:ABC transporter permease [Nitratireductor aquimarinus]|uniref:ABC transporter permease n=1 Tax=Nitratireductor aquimarinus TaxID=889300 RepID=UPI001A8EA348|nr:ABC transporter permease [Nitratireductor aquimarinus]MBN8245668.1 ABC transporter permease [Nitratireductor aquimarinus]MBY6134051.1 ABC transporter permease [Nitratireductor aquimarinus]MCA1305147.1 ABC transporter permease [Nitratireductor aquimarinus]
MRLNYLLSRFAQMIVVMVGVSILVFVLTRVLPGDPVAAALGDRATAEQITQLRAELGLDLPLWQQYGRFVAGVFSGDMGMSLVEKRNVGAIVAERLPATLELIFAALLIAVVVGVPLGVLAAVYRNGIIDQVSRVVALFGVSFPQFWVGIMLQLLMGLALALLPITGRSSVPMPQAVTGFLTIDSLIALDFTAFGNAIRHLICPALVLAAGPLATIMRMVRANMIDEFEKPYPELARAVGMHPFIINFKYVLRNAFTPTLTLIGFLIPIMIGSSFVVEKVFAWPGLARFGADAIMGNDFNGVIGITLVICYFVVLLNLIVDLLYPIIDPRIRLGGER